jgi:Ser/Thr protein kinase RdoA (MazF antagonist)
VSDIEILDGAILLWLEERGWKSPQRILGGRNNRIFKVSGNEGPAALKIYYRGPGDVRDRFAAERAFYAVVERVGVSAPRWLDSDEPLGISLLSWINGRELNANTSLDDVHSAAVFLTGVNQGTAAEKGVPFDASEARFSIADHVALLEERLELLEDAARGWPALADFVSSTLRPFARSAGERLMGSPDADFNAWGGRRILSPGDFGLHNALRQDNGRIVFFDFEYSGWDDPVKTVADIFLQPEKPVDWALLPDFCDGLDMRPGLEDRVRAWAPFFASKWAVILLGSAARSAARRREFAGESTDEAVIAAQIAKAGTVIRRGELV